MPPDYYQILGVLPTATPAEVQQAYLTRRGQLNAATQDPETAAQLKILDEALAVLADPARRLAYDRSRADGTGAGALMVASTPAPPGVVMSATPPTPMLQRLCPYCGAPNPAQAIACSQCQKQVANPCPQCGQIIELTQTVCPRCNTVIQDYLRARTVDTLVVDQRLTTERQTSEARVDSLEAVHRDRAVKGVAFWLIVVVGCLSLPVIAAMVVYLLSNSAW